MGQAVALVAVRNLGAFGEQEHVAVRVGKAKRRSAVSLELDPAVFEYGSTVGERGFCVERQRRARCARRLAYPEEREPETLARVECCGCMVVFFDELHAERFHVKAHSMRDVGNVEMNRASANHLGLTVS